MGTVVFGWDSMDEVAHLLRQTFSEGSLASESSHGNPSLN